MKDGDVVRVALIGCKGYSQKFNLPAYQYMKNARLVAVADIDEQAAARAAAEYKIPSASGDPFSVLKDDDVDAVEIATPNFTHVELAVAAANAGKHILVQKPMATSVQECNTMIEAADRAGVMLSVFMMFRGNHLMHDIQTLLQSGVLGRISSIRARMAHGGGLSLPAGSWRRSRRLTGGGCLALLGVHWINLFRWYLGEIARVKAFSKTLYCDMEGDDVTGALLEFKSGQIGMLETAYCVQPGGDMLEIYGDQGELHYHKSQGVHIWAKRPFDGKIIKYLTPGEHYHLAPPVDAPGMVHGMYYTFHEEFYQAILEGKISSLGGRDGRVDVAVLEAIYRAAGSGGTETVLP